MMVMMHYPQTPRLSVVHHNEGWIPYTSTPMRWEAQRSTQIFQRSRAHDTVPTHVSIATKKLRNLGYPQG